MRNAQYIKLNQNSSWLLIFQNSISWYCHPTLTIDLTFNQSLVIRPRFGFILQDEQAQNIVILHHEGALSNGSVDFFNRENVQFRKNKIFLRPFIFFNFWPVFDRERIPYVLEQCHSIFRHAK